MYLFGFGDSCCGILIKWKMDKRITIYHGSEKNIEQPVFGKGKKIFIIRCTRCVSHLWQPTRRFPQPARKTTARIMKIP